MKQKRMSLSTVRTLLEDQRVRRWENDGWTLYAAEDVVAVLAETNAAGELWQHLRHREPELEGLCHNLDVEGGETVEVMEAEGVLRLVQFIPGRRAQKLRALLAHNAIERLAEENDPELAVLRTREAYARQGRTRRWIDQRLRSVSGRHELTREWYRRGARESDDFRDLTNELTERCFGMDVETFRRSRGLTSTSANLRDHLSDLDLGFLSLGESLAVQLHRERNSTGINELLRDIRDAGAIVAQARRSLHDQLARAPQAA